MTNHCKYCEQEIVWRENQEGKWIATDPERNDPYTKPEWHRCSAWREYSRWKQSTNKKYCYNCKEEIYFSEENKAVSGKYIPMDPKTDNPHKCKKHRSLDELFWNT